MKYYSFSIVCLLFSTIIAFQNCGTNNKNSFSSEVDSEYLSSLDTQSGSSLSNEQLLNTNLAPLTTKEPSTPPPIAGSLDTTTSTGEEISDDDPSPTEGPKDYICVLDGNGKSIRIGIENRNLQEDNSSTKTVCMSEASCLQIVAKKLKVKSAEKRGYCKGHSPQIVILDILQIIGLVEKL